MGPVEIPRSSRVYHPRGLRSQGGYSVAEAFPVGRVPGLPQASANPAGAAPVEGVAQGSDAAASLALPDILKARVSIPSDYGFFTAIGGSVALVDVLVLPQPDTKRVFLLIVNPDPNAVLYVQFGSPANNGTGFPIPPNYGSLLFDSKVPQDDIHVIGNVAGGSPYNLLYSNHAEF